MVRLARVAAPATVTLFALVLTALSVPSLARDQPLPAAPAASALLASVAVVSIAETRTAQNPAVSAPAPTLAALVADREASDPRNDEEECLATSVYFESKGEPLEGQLEVAQVVLNRAASGRFARSSCGVVRQRGQFGFVRSGGVFPDVPRHSGAWRKAVAIAGIARDGLWKPVSADALYFNPGRAARNNGMQRVAELGRHVFYR